MMKKSLLFLVMTLMPLASVFAQDAEGEEGAEQQTPVAYTKSLQSVIDDAKFLVSDSHYTTGQSELQAAIDVAEGRLAEFANPTLDPDETTAEAMIRLNNDGVYEAMRTLQAAIDAFVFGNGHADATEKIQNPSFDKDNNNSKTVTSWTVSNFKQNKRDVNYGTNRFNENSEAYNFRYFVEQWIAAGNSLAGSGDINQVVTGLPAGHYRLTADVFVHNQKYSPDNEEAVGVELYANDAVREIGFVGLDDNKTAAFSVDFDITEGQDASIGLRFADVNFNWLGLDNITLLYIGDPEIYNNIANAEKLAAAKEALAASLTAAKETLANEAAPLYRNELQAAIDVASEFGDGATLEALEEAKATLDAEVKTFNSNNKYFTDDEVNAYTHEYIVARSDGIYLINFDTSKEKRLVSSGNSKICSSPVLSPDHNYIAFLAYSALGYSEMPQLYIVPFSGGEPLLINASFDSGNIALLSWQDN